MIATDKMLHFIAGFTIYATVSALDNRLQLGMSSLHVMLVVLLAGVAKEVLDKFTNHDAELMDIIATLIGGLFGLLVSVLFKLL